MANAWLRDPPTKGRRHRSLYYLVKSNGVGRRRLEISGNGNEVEGALEVAHIPGLGPYAYDSWQIFCCDVLCRRATDHNRRGMDQTISPFVPEWRRVLLLDKELRAHLRWMWLREGQV
jgi:methyl-CpG-binding domain protein 4